MTSLKVGKPFLNQHGSRTPGVQLSLSGSTPELDLILESPNAEEIRSVKDAPAEFGVYEYGEYLFFLYRFGNALPWSDTPYHVALEQRFRPVKLELLRVQSRAVLTIILVDANNGLIQALRDVTLTPEVTRALWQAVLLQTTPPNDYDERLEVIYAAITSRQMVALAVTGTGGK